MVPFPSLLRECDSLLLAAQLPLLAQAVEQEKLAKEYHGHAPSPPLHVDSC